MLQQDSLPLLHFLPLHAGISSSMRWAFSCSACWDFLLAFFATLSPASCFASATANSSRFCSIVGRTLNTLSYLQCFSNNYHSCCRLSEFSFHTSKKQKKIAFLSSRTESSQLIATDRVFHSLSEQPNGSNSQPTGNRQYSNIHPTGHSCSSFHVTCTPWHHHRILSCSGCHAPP